MSSLYGCRRHRRLIPSGSNANTRSGAYTRRFAGPDSDAADVAENPPNCRSAHETVSDEFYCGADSPVLYAGCCDQVNGYNEYDTRRRCPYWPSFAHPRWLTCRELYDRRII